MANNTSDSGAAKRPLFQTAFRGYAKGEVDAFLNQVAKEVSQLQEDLRQAHAERDEMNLRASGLEQKLHSFQAQSEELAKVRAERENLLKEIAALGERVGIAEADAVEKGQRLLEATRERASADPILRAAQETADRMVNEAKQQAARVIADAESRATVALEDMRRKMEALGEELETARREYEEFLSGARRHAQEFQRKLEERASDKYLS